MKVEELLKLTNHPVITATQDETVQAALRKLVKNNIGALPVLDDAENVIGIVSERDLLKECAERAGNIGKTQVKDVMVKDVVIGVLDDDLEYVESMMSQNHFRHLPIMDGDKLAGMVSVRDIVEHQLKHAQAEARFLNTYIAGHHR